MMRTSAKDPEDLVGTTGFAQTTITEQDGLVLVELESHMKTITCASYKGIIPINAKVLITEYMPDSKTYKVEMS